MDNKEKIKEWVSYYSDVVVLTPKNNGENLKSAKALLLSLRKLNKNATLMEANDCPLAQNEAKPATAQQADFLISIKEGGSKLSQLFYEKTTAGLNLFLKTDGKELKKEDIVLKPLKPEQMLITIGLDSYYNVPISLKEKSNFIINISNQPNNQWFGDVNLIEYDKPIEKICFEVIKILGEILFEKEICHSLPTNIASLIKKVFLSLSFDFELDIIVAKLSHFDFISSKTQIKDLKFVLEKLNSGIFSFQGLLLLWEQNSSPLSVRGVFYSKSSQENIQKIEKLFPGQKNNNGLIFKTQETSLQKAELKIINSLK